MQEVQTYPISIFKVLDSIYHILWRSKSEFAMVFKAHFTRESELDRKQEVKHGHACLKINCLKKI